LSNPFYSPPYTSIILSNYSDKSWLSKLTIELLTISIDCHNDFRSRLLAILAIGPIIFNLSDAGVESLRIFSYLRQPLILVLRASNYF